MISARSCFVDLVTISALILVASCEPERSPDPSVEAEPTVTPAAGAGAEDNRTATVTAINGSVTIAERGQPDEGAAILDGERISTGADGTATLAFTSGAELRLVPRTSIVVARHPTKRDKVTVALLVGLIWNRVASVAGGGESYQVHTATAVCGVRGTEFRVAMGLDGQTTVQVTKGAVEVRPQRKKKVQAPVRVASGKQVRVPAEVLAATPVAVEEISREALPETPAEVEGWYGAQLAAAKGNLTVLTAHSVAEGAAAQRELGATLAQLGELEKKRGVAVAALEQGKQDPALASAIVEIDARLDELSSDAVQARSLMVSYLSLVEAIGERVEADPAVAGGATRAKAIATARTEAGALTKKSESLRRDMQRLDDGALAEVVETRGEAAAVAPTSAEVEPAKEAPVVAPEPARREKAVTTQAPKRARPKAAPVPAKKALPETAAPKAGQPAPEPAPAAAPKPAPEKAAKPSDAPEASFAASAASADDALAPATTQKRIALAKPDPKRDWNTPAELQAAMDKLCAQMDKIARISPVHISMEQKVEELELRLGILREMDAALAAMITSIQARMTKASDSNEGMKLFQQLQAAKILQPNLKNRIQGYDAQVRELRRAK